MNVNKAELTEKLLTVREVIGVMRESGMTDNSIIDQFGLSPVQLGKGTQRLLKAIKDKEITETETLESIAKKMGWNSHNAVLYHLKKLKKHGYIV